MGLISLERPENWLTAIISLTGKGFRKLSLILPATNASDGTSRQLVPPTLVDSERLESTQ